MNQQQSPQVSLNSWVPVTERLPVESQRILLAVEDEYGKRAIFGYYRLFPHMEWTDEDEYELTNVSHWSKVELP